MYKEVIRMQESWEKVLSMLIEGLGSLMFALLCIGMKYLITLLKNRIKNEKAKQLLDEIQQAVLDGIYFTEQTAVKELKENGKWNSTTQQEVLKQCADYVENVLSAEAIEFLSDNQDTIQQLITQKIEAKLGKLHAEIKEEESDD